MSDISGSVEGIADELYALPPAQFTAARDAAATRARDAGDRAAVKSIAALKRPTQGAHLVNLLALRSPEVIAELIELGEQIRAAQGTVPAAALRELSTRRRSAIGAVLRRCRDLAVETGSGEPTAQQLGEAEATLAAAMADDAAAEQVRAGHLSKALTYAGFGAGFGAAAPLRSAGAAGARSGSAGQRRRVERDENGDHDPVTTPRTPEAELHDEAQAQAARRLRERAAWERLARAEAGLGVAQEQERAANDELDRIADEISRLRGALDEASRRARAARTARQAAERALALARREVSTEDGGG